MAIDYSINPYSAGAVVFDQRPSLQFAQNQIARQQAKETALDNYFRDLNKNVTPAGMRSQDVPSLLEKQKEWQQFYQTNKSAITNPKLDNGKAYSEYFARYQDQLGHIQGSKEAMKATDQVGKMRMNPQLSYVFDDPKIIDQIQSHEKPINDPSREGINLATMSVPPKPWGIKEHDQYNQYLTRNIPFTDTIGKTENLPGFKTRTEIIKDYGREGKKTIGQRSMDMYDADRDIRIKAKHLEDELANDPTRLEQLNNVFKGVYGRDMDGAKEALAAQDIINQDLKSRSYKEGTDEWGRDNAMRQLRQADAKELIKFKKQIDPNDTEMNNVWYQTYLDDVMNTAKTSGERHHVYTTKGKSVTYYNMIKPDPFLMKAFQRGKSEPDRLGVTEGGEIIPIFFKYDKDGNVEKTNGKTGAPVIDTEYSQPLSYNQALVNLGYRGSTKKQLKEDQQKIQSKSSVGSFKVNGKSYSRKQLNEMGYDDNEITDYLKSGIITQ